MLNYQIRVIFLAIALTGAIGKKISYAQTATLPIGSGTLANPYQIATLENLYWITTNSANWNKYYIQTANIDASATSSWASKFPPIAGTSDFTGVYDGNGKMITGLSMGNSSSSYGVGLFSSINGGTIKNLQLKNINYSYITSPSFIGGITGNISSNGGTIENCGVSGSITSSNHIGGLVGTRNSGGTAIIKQCWASIDINATGSSSKYVGGIIGWAGGSIDILDCFFSGIFQSSSSKTFGGVAGFFNGNFGAVNIVRSYSTGTFSSAIGTKGAIIGSTGAGTMTSSGGVYYDNQLIPPPIVGIGSGSLSSGSISGVSSANMKVSSTFTGWDFATVWQINSSSNNGYPYLIQNSITLPVNFQSFTATKSPTFVELNWSTASEQNNSHFEVERSADALQFSKIGRVNASTNPLIKNDYQYLDQSPIPARSFYRLKQVDLDGKFSYSSIIQINGELATGISTWVIPGTNKLIVVIPQSLQGVSELSIYDATGRTLQRQQILPGRSEVNLKGVTSVGVYFVKVVKNNSVLYTNKFIN